MSELTKEKREKEFERLIHELLKVLDDDICPLPIPAPEQIHARKKGFKKNKWWIPKKIRIMFVDLTLSNWMP